MNSSSKRPSAIEEEMTALREKCLCRTSSILRSRSEGILFDLNSEETVDLHRGNIQTASQLESQAIKTKNPFWIELSASNPFLDDIVKTNAESKQTNAYVSVLKNDLCATFKTTNDISTSSDERIFNHVLNDRKMTEKSFRCKSTSDILDAPDEEENTIEISSLNASSQFFDRDCEWLKNDREAYKMAWLSHRQLTRSCLDLGHVSLGWAQTQAAETQIVCKVGHTGGSIQLPHSDISAHIPAGHVLPGDLQKIGLKAILDPPSELNNEFMTTLSPLLEITLSNLSTQECILLEMKVAGEIRTDPLSQVMTKLICLISQRREGPYQRIRHCYLYENTLQVKLVDLYPHFHIIAVAQATILQPPVTSVWDYMERLLTIGIYGPKHIHPSFTAVYVIFGHTEVPLKVPFSNIKRGGKNLPPVIFQLWGKQSFKLNGLKDLHILTRPLETLFYIKASDQVKDVKKSQIKAGYAIQLPILLSKTGNMEVVRFKLEIDVKDLDGLLLTKFQVLSPESVASKTEKHSQTHQESREVLLTKPIPKLVKFQNKTISIKTYAVALKSVFRQPHVEYLLEYLKGDTLAILTRETFKSIGQSKEKEWYIGFLKGRVGLVHCKNIKVISKEQVIDFADLKVTTQLLLDNITLPFKNLTYMYSAIETLVTKEVSCWRTFAEVLGYVNLSLDEISWRPTESESEKVACVLERLKEDCHRERSKKKFQRELIAGLLKMDSQNLVVHLIQNTVILSTAVEVGVRWQELAERLVKLSSAHIADYEAPHRGKNGEISTQAMWKPAYDFLFTWSKCYGDQYKTLIQDLHLGLDKMKSPVTRQWREITGALITVNCMEMLRAAAF